MEKTMSVPKTTIITGATGGIGAALAKTYFDQGHNLVLTGRNEEKLEMMVRSFDESVRITTIAGDLRDSTLGNRIIAHSIERFGHTLQNLVNNAGTFLVKPFLETEFDDLSEFQEFFAGSYFLTQAAAAQMKTQARKTGRETQNGAIVFISTIFTGGFIPMFPSSAVGSIKASFAGFTKNVAYELAALGICVNTLELGVIETPIYGLDEQGLADLKPLQPLGRLGQPDDVAKAVSFLTEDSPFTTGQTFAIDGGASAGHFCGLPN